MRMRDFVMGGLIGAAALVALNRSYKKGKIINFSTLKDSVMEVQQKTSRALQAKSKSMKSQSFMNVDSGKHWMKERAAELQDAFCHSGEERDTKMQ